MPAPTPFVHQHAALKLHELQSHIHGPAQVSTVNISNLAHTQVQVSTTNCTGAGWLIKTQTYSYDGRILVDSYVSDI